MHAKEKRAWATIGWVVLVYLVFCFALLAAGGAFRV